AIDHLQKLHHVLPAVHSSPADLPFSCQSLAEAVSDLSSLLKCLSDQLGISFRILGPVRYAGSRVNTDHAIVSYSEFLQLLTKFTRLTDHVHEGLALISSTHGISSPDRSYQRTHLEIILGHLVGEFLSLVRIIEVKMRLKQPYVEAVKLNTVHLSGGSHLQERIKRNDWLRVSTLSDQSRPGGIMDFREVVHC